MAASSHSPDFSTSELLESQRPALQLLLALGYEYLSPRRARELRGGRLGEVVLEPVLRDALKRINRIQAGGELHLFSEENLSAAIQKLKNLRFDGLLTGNAEVHELLTLGTALEQTIDGDMRARSLRYVDWEQPEANSWQVSPEFVVERQRSTQTVRLDLVCFVNGMPWAVIECKAPGVPVDEGVSGLISYQGSGQAPQLFVYAQLLLALNRHSAKVGAVGTALKFYGNWPEVVDEEALRQALAQPLPPALARELNADAMEALLQRQGPDEPGGVAEPEAAYHAAREPSAQDRAMFALLRPSRLLSLVQHYTVFDGGERKLARHQQVRAIEKMVARIQQWEPSPVNRVQQDPNARRRRGGVVWHTQGSGKSLTMVMLARRIAQLRGVVNPRIVLVTDREDLDAQIGKTFMSCELKPERARSARELLALVQSPKAQLITTLIQKFDRVGALAKSFRAESPDIFVLVDESHRTNFGSLAARMRLLMPNACYIGFTGTPVTRKERDTLQRFGGLIDSYTMNEAVKDGAVVRLFYESRLVDVKQDQPAMDTWWRRIVVGLSEAEQADLKRKFSRANLINASDRVLQMMAFDISEHFRANWQGTPFKGQVVAQSRAAAVKLKEYLDEIGHVSAEVLISGPQHRRGHEDVDDEPNDDVHRFWAKMMARYGNEEAYNEGLIGAFKQSDRPELLIVKDKLLTGFDAPRNRVLYLTRELKAHTLLQAIARVNRLYEQRTEDGGRIEKEYGQIVDYAGVLKELKGAMSSYEALAGFADEDLLGTVESAYDEVLKLPDVHAHLLELFRELPASAGMAAHEELLRDEAMREEFYTRLSAFGRLLALAFGLERFLAETPAVQVERYKADLKRLMALKQSAQLRFAEAVDFRRHYEPRIRKLLNVHLAADEVLQLHAPVDIFDPASVDAALQTRPESERGPAAQADVMAHNLKRVIDERIKLDPAQYERFSKLVQDAIDDYKAKRINELAYLAQVKAVRDGMAQRPQDEVPAALRGQDDALAVYGLVRRIFEGIAPDRANALAEMTAQAVMEALGEHAVVDYWRNLEAVNATKTALDHFLYDVLGPQLPTPLTSQQMDAVIEQSMQLARRRGLNGR
ncbi:type I restriction endonuclease subunit R [Roseateles sp. BYS78W]|uniref:Type I restriction enzyme endonuclease subunit n=1 Tax=Pelomonas candidula TaxID=3299025 RepID=A0ABW7H5U9_9BURK